MVLVKTPPTHSPEPPVKAKYDPTADFKVLKAVLWDYSEDQERDDHGRFASGGGGGESSHTPLSDEERGNLLQRDTLSKDEWRVLEDYSVADSHVINGELRGVLDQTAVVQQQVAHLDSAFTKSPGLPHDAVLYRGIGERGYGELHVGDVVTDKGFVSTSTSQAVATRFSGGQVVEIHAGAGTSALRGNPSEKEVLLPRGSSFKITETRPGLNGVNHLVAELVAGGGRVKNTVDGRLYAYSEDQERDERGRFGSGGVGSLSPTPLTTQERNALPGARRSLDSSEKAVLEDYVVEGYQGINESLREGSTVDTRVEKMDSMMAKSSGLPHDTVLYRGVEPDTPLFSGLKPGVDFTDKAFVSTSTNEKIGRTAYGSAPGETRLLEVHVPTGIKALNGGGFEKEVILQRGLTFHVTSVQPNKITVEVPRSTKNISAGGLYAYSPDQEREDNGRFGSGGTGFKELSEGATFALPGPNNAETGAPVVLSKDETDAVRVYTTAAFGDINETLRAGEPMHIGRPNPYPELVKEYAGVIAQVDAAFDKSPGLPHDAILYRGVGSSGYADTIGALKVGDTFVDKAFVSTSSSQFQGSKFGTALEIHVPAGTKALSGSYSEREVILPRGTTFKVTSVSGGRITTEVQR